MWFNWLCRSASGWRTCSDHRSGVNGDTSASKSHSSPTNGYICKDCSFHSQRTDAYVTQSASSSSSQLVQSSSDILSSSSSSSSPFTSIYSRDRSRRNKTGEELFCSARRWRDSSRCFLKKLCSCQSVMVAVSLIGVLRSMCNACVRYSKQGLAPLLTLVTVVFSSVVWLASQARASTGRGELC